MRIQKDMMDADLFCEDTTIPDTSRKAAAENIRAWLHSDRKNADIIIRALDLQAFDPAPER